MKCKCGHDSREHRSSYRGCGDKSSPCTIDGCVCKDFIAALEEWARQYYEQHKCFNCKGEGVVPSDDPYEPGNVVCNYCDGKCINGTYEKPTFDELFGKMRNITNMDDRDRIIEEFDKKIILSGFFFGNVRRGKFVVI